jgi:hypothetical protein
MEFRYIKELDKNHLFFRVLKTPTEEIWPGVAQLPDYKATFPNWTQYNLTSHVRNIEEDGLDLLQVSEQAVLSCNTFLLNPKNFVNIFLFL